MADLVRGRRLKSCTEASADSPIAFDDQLVYLGDTTAPSIDRALTTFAPQPQSAVVSSHARCTLGAYPALQ